MTKAQKQYVVEELKALTEKSSQSRVAKRAQVSTATISQMINHNWKLIRDEMWQRVKVNLHIEWNWMTADISNLRMITKVVKAAQDRSMSVCISHNAGYGKSYTYRLYARTYDNVIHLECKNYWTKKTFIQQLCIACGLESDGKTGEMIERFTDHLKTLQKAVVVFDQADKLKDPQLDLFMDFYNDLDGHCGFVLSGVPALKKRIEKGCQHDKPGYKEIRSRIGRKYIKFPAMTAADVEAVCLANGVGDKDFINEVYNTCDDDLRRVRRSIEQYFLMQNAG